MTISRAMVFALLLAATACAPGLRQLSTPAERAVIPHAIFVDNEGRGVRADSTASGKAMSDAEYRAHVSEMMAGLRRAGVKRVLVRVHGGLNTLNGALDATSKMRERIMADTAAAGYPIFINWESGIKSSYLEHLTMISQGQRYPTFAREVIATPFYFLADAGRAVKRAPIVWAGQLARYWHSQPLTASQPDPVASLVATGDIDRWEGTYSRGAGEVTRFVASSTVLSPVKMFSAVVVDAGGTPGWDNMRRRTKTMFRQPSEFTGVREAAAAMRTEVAADMNVKRAGSAEEHRLAATYGPGTGAVAILFDSLKAFEDSTPGAEITLIGHSMGAIIVNEIIRTQPKMDFKNIVFMASAGTIRDFETSVIPYLEEHKGTQFYNLSLHPLADLHEQSFFSLTPNGSLLEWIDGFFGNPESDLDRMLGKYSNITQALHIIPPKIYPQIHIKAFGYNDGMGCGAEKNIPHEHGQFNDDSVPYWNPKLWRGGVPCPPVPAPGTRVSHPLWYTAASK